MPRDYIQVLADLISFDTSVPPGRNYQEAVRYLQPLFAEAGFETETVPIPPQCADGGEGRVNLVAHRREPGKPRLVFYAHIDVVPAAGWAAFSPAVREGKVYGRGAADMKGAIAGLLSGLTQVAARRLKYDTSVIITTDEETGQADQLQFLRRHLEPVAGGLFFSLDSAAGYVAITGLGALQMEIIVRGKSVHSGMSHLGENAVEGAGRLVAALLGLKEKVSARRSATPVHRSTGLTVMEPRLNINMISGGLKANIVPDEAVITIDRRLIPEEDIEEARKEIIATLSAVPDVRWEFGKVFAIPTVPPCDHPATVELSALIRETTGEGGRFGEMGSGDLGHVVRGWGGTEFGFGVIRPECAIHGKDEFVYERDIRDLATVISRFLT